VSLLLLFGADPGGGGEEPVASIDVEVQAAFGFGVQDTITEADWTTLDGVLSVRVRRPSSRNLGALTRYQAGTVTVELDNQDRDFDPSNRTGTYVSGGRTQLKPMVPVRVRAVVSGAPYPIFYGYADTWRPSYSKAAKRSVCTLTATDATKILSRFNGPEQTSQGQGESPGLRINRILDNADWPSGLRAIPTTATSFVQATTLARPAWEEILLTADSTLGAVFVDRHGRVRLMPVDSLKLGSTIFYGTVVGLPGVNPAATSQATWTDDPTETGFRFSDPVVSYDDELIYNQVNLARVGGSSQTAQDLLSQAEYGVSSLTRTDLILLTDTDCLAFANRLLGQLREPRLRIEGITYKPGSFTEQIATAPAVFNVEMLDRWTVKFTPPGGGDQIIQDVWIAGIEYEFGHAGRFSARFQFQPILHVGFTLDSPTLGVLDAGIALTY
jgi:hypothetical protein